MDSFFDSPLCKNRNHCKECRCSDEYRSGIVQSFNEPSDVDFECPFGKKREDFPPEVEATLFEMVGSFGRALRDEAVAVIKGEQKKGRAEENRRLAICNGCNFFRAKRQRCAKCGCFVSLKARMRTGRCPIGKW
jgi:hypothetical protein